MFEQKLQIAVSRRVGYRESNALDGVPYKETGTDDLFYAAVYFLTEESLVLFSFCHLYPFAH